MPAPDWHEVEQAFRNYKKDLSELNNLIMHKHSSHGFLSKIKQAYSSAILAAVTSIFGIRK